MTSAFPLSWFFSSRRSCKNMRHSVPQKQWEKHFTLIENSYKAVKTHSILGLVLFLISFEFNRNCGTILCQWFKVSTSFVWSVLKTTTDCCPFKALLHLFISFRLWQVSSISSSLLSAVMVIRGSKGILLLFFDSNDDICSFEYKWVFFFTCRTE